MQNATLFIEQFKDIRNGRLMQSARPLPITFLNTSLGITAASRTLKTVAVFKIALKSIPVVLVDEVNDTRVIVIDQIN